MPVYDLFKGSTQYARMDRQKSLRNKRNSPRLFERLSWFRRISGLAKATDLVGQPVNVVEARYVAMDLTRPSSPN